MAMALAALRSRFAAFVRIGGGRNGAWTDGRADVGTKPGISDALFTKCRCPVGLRCGQIPVICSANMSKRAIVFTPGSSLDRILANFRKLNLRVNIGPCGYG